MRLNVGIVWGLAAATVACSKSNEPTAPTSSPAVTKTAVHDAAPPRHPSLRPR